MEFTIPTKLFHEAMMLAAICVKTDADWELAKQIKISVPRDGVVQLQTVSHDSGRALVEIRDVLATTGEWGEAGVLIPFLELEPYIKSAPADAVTFRFVAKGKEKGLWVFMGKSRTHYKKCSLCDYFPAMPDHEGQTVEMAGSDFGRAVDLVAFSAGKNDFQAAMTGVRFFSNDDERLSFMALDGYRMSYFATDMRVAGLEKLVPAKMLSRILARMEDDCTVRFTFGQKVDQLSDMTIELGNLHGKMSLRVACLTIEHQFPNPKRMVELAMNGRSSVTVEAKTLVEAEKVVGAIKTPNKTVDVEMGVDRLQITTRNSEMGNAGADLELMDAAVVEPFAFRLSQDYLTQISRRARHRVKISGSGAKSPFLFLVDDFDQKNYYHIIMPVEIPAN